MNLLGLRASVIAWFAMLMDAYRVEQIKRFYLYESCTSLELIRLSSIRCISFAISKDHRKKLCRRRRQERDEMGFLCFIKSVLSGGLKLFLKPINSPLKLNKGIRP